ncbi:MAG: polysaccharide pyruvyl transferase family protein [Oscillospiraceae bacterium]|nr:polysaccharide pyruvyl transferase family protein [Oscillospiraceae bacterium]
MKVGILTFHNADNFGAVLQVYALQTYLIRKGFSVEVIDFRPKYVDSVYKVIPSKFKDNKRYMSKDHVKRACLNILNPKKYKERKNGFLSFRRDNLKITEDIYRTCEDLKKLSFDAYIFGSDQVWNPTITNGVEGAFFGAFSQGDAKKISYAASMGSKEVPEQYREKFKELVSALDSISVREYQGAETIKTYTDKSVEHVLDPTLLIDIEEMNKVAKMPEIQGEYLLLYSLTMAKSDDRIYKVAYELADKLGLKVIEIDKKGTHDPKYKKHECLLNINPAQFLGLIKEASFVVSNSFHGTAFAIANKKPFYTFGTRATSERMLSILNMLEIPERFLDNKMEVDEIKEIDYEKIGNKLKSEKAKSEKFLMKALSGEE